MLTSPYPWSLSARRAWIEMIMTDDALEMVLGRSPQGERGLKLEAVKAKIRHPVVALRKESVD